MMSSQNAPNTLPTSVAAPVTVAVVTHSASFVVLEEFLTQLKPAIENYKGQCELLIVNNSGKDAALLTQHSIDESGISGICSTQVIASPQNNISTARNLALEFASHDTLIFLDDDEFPVPMWLTHHLDAMHKFDAQMVSGPTFPLFLFDTPNWITNVDLHNTGGKKTGQCLEKVGAGNLLIQRSRIIGGHFDEDYGRSGGEDTEFVLRQVQAGLKLVWSNEAAAYEYMPAGKSTTRYYIKRFVLQGQLHRQVLTDVGAIQSQIGYTLRSVAMVAVSVIIAPLLLLVSSKHAGKWIKRGFANVGHITSFKKKLYP